MKKIVLLIDTLIGGGAEKIVLNFARTFASFGHQVHIILVKNIIEYELENNYQVHYLSENGKLHKNKFINKYKLSQALKNKIKQIQNIDNKPVNLIISNAEDMDLLGKKAKLDNFYLRYRNSMFEYYKSKFDSFSGFKRWRRKTKYKLLFKRIYNNQNIVTVSKALVNDITHKMGIKPTSIQTIYNPFDFEYIKNLANKKDDDIPNEKYLIYVAKFENRKNQLLLINAYHKSGVKHPLVLMGDTHTKSDEEYLQQIKDLVKKLNLEKKVIFTGFKQNPYPLIKNAELFVMSSNSEGLPLVLVEAMILNTKVISTNCPTGPSELLTNNLAQFLSPVGSITKLADNIQKALNNYPKIDEKNLEKFRAEYSVNKYLELCK